MCIIRQAGRQAGMLIQTNTRKETKKEGKKGKKEKKETSSFCVSYVYNNNNNNMTATNMSGIML